MTDWPKIRLLEGRLAWHLGKYHYGKMLWLQHKAKGDTAHDWYAKHMHNGERAAAAVNMKQIELERTYIRKWADYMAGELTEIEALRSEIARLRPKPPPEPTGVAAMEATLLRRYPDTHDGIRKVVAKVLVANPQMYVTATTGGNHHTHSYHWLGRAYDLGANSQDAKDRCGAWCNEHVAGLLTEGIHNPNLSVKYGQRVGSWYWGSATWAGHVDHVHLAV